MFYIRSDCIKISDHLPVSVELHLLLDFSLLKRKQSITDIVAEQNNHSKKPRIVMEKIDKNTFINIMNHQLNNLKNYRNNTTDQTLKELKNTFYISAKGAKIRDFTSAVKKTKTKHEI